MSESNLNENQTPEVQLVEQENRTDVAEPTEDPLAWLEPAERFALDYFLENFQRGGSETYAIAPSVAEGMLQLYLQGRTLSEIRKLNKQFGLGQIVHAAIINHWREQRDAYAALAVARAKARAVLAAAEGVELAADIIAALRRQHGDNVSRYLQTGELSALGPATSMATIRQLKEVAEVLMRLTGQDQKRQVSGSLEVKHTGTVTTVPVTAPPPSPVETERKLLSDWAAAEKARIAEELKG